MSDGADPEFHFHDLESKCQKFANASKVITDEDFITLFLASLPESYDSFCQSIQWDIVTRDSLLHHVQMYALRLKRREEISAFTASHKPKEDRSLLMCTHCGGRHHTENECWADQ